jgi:type IV pilus assembly protein PilA
VAWLNRASDPVDTSVMRTVTKAETPEDGFTLVELLVVVLVIAILMAIAIPSFLGARSRALDRAAQVNVRHALTAEHIVFTDNQQYSAASATMTASEPRLIYVSAVPAKDSPEVYVGTDATSETVVLGARSGSGKCFWARQASPANSGALRWNQSTDCSSPPAVDDAGFTLESAPA